MERLLTCTFALVATLAIGQGNINYSSYYLNRSLYNPASVGTEGATELYVNFRTQWVGVQGAPQTGSVNIHHPVGRKVSLGLTAFQDRAGVVKQTSGLGTFAYHVPLGKSIDSNHWLSFGLSVGMVSNTISGTDNPDDPVISNNTSMHLDGQFGVQYRLNGLKIDAAVPGLLRPYLVNENSFVNPDFKSIDYTITSVSYDFRLGSWVSFEPMAVFVRNPTNNRIEGMGVLKLKNLIWIGGGYRQHLGMNVVGGLRVSDLLKVGYAYESTTEKVATFNNGTHEIQLVLRLGKRKVNANTAKESVPEHLPEDELISVEDRMQAIEQANLLIAEEKNKQQQLKTTPQTLPVDSVVLPSDSLVKFALSESFVNRDSLTKKSAINQSQIVDTIAVSTDSAKASVRQANPVDPLKSEIKQEQAPVQVRIETNPRTLEGETLPDGFYVVVGVFKFRTNAEKYSQLLSKSTYPSTIAYVPGKDYYIVHMGHVSELAEAAKLRDYYRAKSRYSFSDTWVLRVP